jgi:hypothetical protein
MMATLCLKISKEDNQKQQMEQRPKRKEIIKDIQGSTKCTTKLKNGQHDPT